MKQLTSSEQARADAMADAETLRWNYPRASRGEAYRVRGALRSLRDFGAFALDSLRAPADEGEAVYWTTEACRAAFRAVPGLKGE